MLNARTPATISSIRRRYYAISLGYALAGGFLVGVYPIFLRSRGLDQLRINSLLAAYFAVTLVMDVPTGAFADALGRRLSFLLGSGLRGAAFALYFVSHTYVLFLVAETIDAVGTAFCNGAVDAWGVDALDEAGFEGAKDHLFSRVVQFSGLGLMTTAVLGADVAGADLAWPWLLGAAGFAVCAAMSALMHRARRRTSPSGVAPLVATIATRAVRGLRLGFGRRSVWRLSLAEGIVLAAWAPFWLEWPLLFNDSYGVGVWVVGWIFCLLSVGHMVGAEVVVRTEVEPSRRPWILAGLVLGVGGSIAAGGLLAGRPGFALGALFLMSMCLGAREPIARTWFNEEVGAEDRATMLSFRSTLATVGGALGLLLGGYAVNVHGIPFRWGLAGALASLAVPCYLSLRRRSPSP